MKGVFYFLFVLEVFVLFFMIGLLIVALKDYREIKELKQKYIKAKKIKSKALCNTCKHSHYCDDWTNDCRDCEQYVGEYHCRCSDVEHGEKCEYFKPIESEVNNNEN
jgi:hypothetical protein